MAIGYATVQTEDLRAVLDALTTDSSFTIGHVAAAALRLACACDGSMVVTDAAANKRSYRSGYETIAEQVEAWART